MGMSLSRDFLPGVKTSSMGTLVEEPVYDSSWGRCRKSGLEDCQALQVQATLQGLLNPAMPGGPRNLIYFQENIHCRNVDENPDHTSQIVCECIFNSKANLVRPRNVVYSTDIFPTRAFFRKRCTVEMLMKTQTTTIK